MVLIRYRRSLLQPGDGTGDGFVAAQFLRLPGLGLSGIGKRKSNNRSNSN
jgi:hypothetical protein